MVTVKHSDVNRNFNLAPLWKRSGITESAISICHNKWLNKRRKRRSSILEVKNIDTKDIDKLTINQISDRIKPLNRW